MSKYRVYFLKSGNFYDIDESEVEETKKFYKLKFFVYDEHLERFTDTITNTRNDIFLFKLKPDMKHITEQEVLKILDNEKEGFIAPEWAGLFGEYDYKSVIRACYNLVEKGVLRKRDCTGLAFERV